MQYDYSRSSWQSPSQPVTGPRFIWRDITQIVIHYPGNPPTWQVPQDIAQHLRNMQGYYLRARGYSYGYNAVVVSAAGHPLDGSSWEVRGDTFRSAANAGVNHRSYAIQVVQRSDEAPTVNAIEGVRRLVAQILAQRPNAVIVGHNTSGSTTATACPGRGLAEAVRSGVFMPQPNPQRPDIPQPIRSAAMYTTTTPTRVYDSRTGAGVKLAAGQTVVISTNLPAGATAAHVNVTGIMDGPGFMTTWATGNRPNSSVLNGQRGQAVANAVTVPLDSRRRFRLYAHARSHVIVDVMGYHH